MLAYCTGSDAINMLISALPQVVAAVVLPLTLAVSRSGGAPGVAERARDKMLPLLMCKLLFKFRNKKGKTKHVYVSIQRIYQYCHK